MLHSVIEPRMARDGHRCFTGLRESAMAMEGISMDALLAGLRAAREAAAKLPDGAPASKDGPDFASLLKAGIDRVDQAQSTAGQMAERFQLGDPDVGLADTMLALQKANVSLQAMVQVRNKVVAAYQDIMNLPV
jgi:flagellar hook-basal body complex protein FliE